MDGSRWVRSSLVITAAAGISLLLGAAPASAITVNPPGYVEHTNPTDDPGACFFEPGDVPGIDVQFEATCTFVHEPTGNLRVVARARVPAGYTVASPFHGSLNCTFNGVESSGTIIATKSGQVTATCVVPGGA
ncbi:hypothetical protein GCM10023200_42370 [Actinomycetospora chlora]|uniref:DUF4333 domain-containing protein n=2 Tax=Actinomycetospora chlora TaxID=663608 RepID=A0ABP9BVJ0_9PSEU